METALFTTILVVINVIATFIGTVIGPSPIIVEDDTNRDETPILAEYEEGTEAEPLDLYKLSNQISNVSGEFAYDFFEPSKYYASYTTSKSIPITPTYSDITTIKKESLNNQINLEKKPQLLTRVELPLLGKDYYWGKYINAVAGAKEINKMPVLKPGDRISLIGDGYITLRLSSGYIRPGNGFGYGSGLCWSVSALGQLMDEANQDFREQTGMDLFVFRAGDRSPHSKWYRSYQNSNNGFGYAVITTRSFTMDYEFQVNPALKEKYPNLNVQIILSAQQDHPNAVAGQSINGEVLLSGY